MANGSASEPLDLAAALDRPRPERWSYAGAG
jgi:hypothetical protein